MDGIKKTGPIKALTVLSILIVLSGMAAMTSADGWQSLPNEFYGTVTLNGADAPVGTVINAYIDEELRGTIEVTTAGKYGEMPGLDYLKVDGNESEDEGKPITFKVCGAAADQIGTEWYVDTLPRELNLTAVDNVAPEVTNATATLASIVADGTETTQLNVTVIDGCRVGNVTMNLAAIGGSEAQKMTCIEGTDVYSATVTADVNTAPGAYCLYVNASDVFGTCNTSVCIDLVIKDVEAPVVSNLGANPASIVANGTHESRLNVTVVDDSDIAFVTVNLSDIGGSDAQEMSRIGDTDVYTVTVTAAEGTAGAHYLHVNASDVFENCNTSICIPLEVTSVTSEVQFTISLDAGWNMVSIPAVLGDPSVGTVFPTKVGSVWGWNTTTQGYESVSTLEPTKGYWVLVTSSTTIPLSGSSPSSTLLLETGWNLIGILGLDDVPKSDIPEHIGSVWGWNATIQGYESAAILEPTEGYWVLGPETSGSP